MRVLYQEALEVRSMKMVPGDEVVVEDEVVDLGEGGREVAVGLGQ